jgi:hypothetical protein
MKQILTLVFFLTVSLTNTFAVIAPRQTNFNIQQIGKNEGLDMSNLQNIKLNQFLELTPSKFKEKTGQKLSWKESIALKIAQRKLKKELFKNEAGETSEKSQLTAFLLVLFVGVLGIHRFYMGYIGIGIVQLLTLGGCGIWALIDLIMILTGDLKTKDGQKLKPW